MCIVVVYPLYCPLWCVSLYSFRILSTNWFFYRCSIIGNFYFLSVVYSCLPFHESLIFSLLYFTTFIFICGMNAHINNFFLNIHVRINRITSVHEWLRTQTKRASERELKAMLVSLIENKVLGSIKNNFVCDCVSFYIFSSLSASFIFFRFTFNM